MNPKDAARTAAAYMKGILEVNQEVDGTENPDNVSLAAYDFAIEGMNFDDKSDSWIVTVGYVMPWDRPRSNSPFQLAVDPQSRRLRTYKRVTVRDQDGKVVGFGKDS